MTLDGALQAALRPKALNIITTVLVGMLVVLAVAAPADARHRRSTAAERSCAVASRVPDPTDMRRAESAVVCLLNVERARRGLRRLQVSSHLRLAGVRHAEDMTEHHYFSHDSLSGSSFVARIRRTGYLRRARRWKLGENLAWGERSLASPAAILQAWLASPPHREVMLDPSFDEVGVGAVPGLPHAGGSGPGATYAAEFGRR